MVIYIRMVGRVVVLNGHMVLLGEKMVSAYLFPRVTMIPMCVFNMCRQSRMERKESLIIRWGLQLPHAIMENFDIGLYVLLLLREFSVIEEWEFFIRVGITLGVGIVMILRMSQETKIVDTKITRFSLFSIVTTRS